MSKTLIATVTFGNLEFTKLTINEIRRTTKSPADLLVIVGQPGDHQTAHWLEEQNVLHLVHHVNKGFPASLNDVWDYAWGTGETRCPTFPGYDNVILCANDVVPYPGAMDALIECAETTDWEWICASKFDARALVAMYPETRKFFQGQGCVFTDFAARPWDEHAAHVAATAKAIEPDGFKDVAELTLFKRSVFEKFGYFDANYWPNGYFFDNDAARRAVNLKLRGCGLPHAVYFHFWSRTVHQGERRDHGEYFRRNGKYYRMKGNGGWNEEKHTVPFGGEPLMLAPGIMLPGALRIGDRTNEGEIVEYWSNCNRDAKAAFTALG